MVLHAMHDNSHAVYNEERLSRVIDLLALLVSSFDPVIYINEEQLDLAVQFFWNTAYAIPLIPGATVKNASCQCFHGMTTNQQKGHIMFNLKLTAGVAATL